MADLPTLIAFLTMTVFVQEKWWFCNGRIAKSDNPNDIEKKYT